LAADFYGTAAAVVLRTGVKPDDLGLEDDAALTSAIEDLLGEATDLMNRHIRRATDWNDEADIPTGLHGIANDIVSSTLREMVATRQTPVVRVDDFAVRTLSTRVFTPDMLKRLRLYGARAVSSIDVTPGDLAETGAGVVYASDLDTLDT
jgi:hypothetical protein